jgi:hypothetical protein
VNDFASLSAAVYQPTAGQVYAELAGELAILNSKTGVYFGLDPVGARVWSLILEFRTCEEIRATLLAEYDVSPSQLEADLLNLFCDLSSKGLIETAPPGARERALAAAQSQSQGA